MLHGTAKMEGKAVVKVDILYPPIDRFDADASWNHPDGSLRIHLPDTTCARLFRIGYWEN
jgi:hypothetical protein